MLRPLLSWLTFPGVIVHEFAHAWACRKLGIRVEKVRYLRFGNPMGYVLHERPTSARAHILVATAPFFMSSLFALLAGGISCLGLSSALPPDVRDGLFCLMLWLGFSSALHAFPSSGDMGALHEDLSRPEFGFFAKALLLPVIGILGIVSWGRRYYLDVFYALALVALPPTLLLALG